MTCLVQINVYTTVNSKKKRFRKKKNDSLPTYPETEE